MRLSRRSVRVTCDECNQNIPINVKQRHLPDGGVEHYFICGNCGSWYTIGTITGLGVEFQKRLRRLISVSALAAHLAPGPMVIASYGEISKLRAAMLSEVTGQKN